MARYDVRRGLAASARAGRFRSHYADAMKPPVPDLSEQGRRPTPAALAIACETHGAAPGSPCWTDAVCGARVTRAMAPRDAS